MAAELYVDVGDEEDTAGLATKVPQSPSSAGVAAALSRMSAYDLDPMCTDGRMLLVFFPGARALIFYRSECFIFDILRFKFGGSGEFTSFCFLALPRFILLLVTCRRFAPGRLLSRPVVPPPLCGCLGFRVLLPDARAPRHLPLAVRLLAGRPAVGHSGMRQSDDER